MTVPADKESRSRIVEPPRAFTPGRIVALALIGLAVLGLAYLRFGSGSDPVSVPNGAQAGDLILDRCDYETENGATKPTAERWSCPRIEPIRSRG